MFVQSGCFQLQILQKSLSIEDIDPVSGIFLGDTQMRTCGILLLRRFRLQEGRRRNERIYGH